MSLGVPVPARRRRHWGAATLASLLLSGCTVSGAPTVPVPSAAGTLAGIVLRVTRVADGDTFTGTDAAGAKVKVRMLAIDAPELAHDGIPAACGAQTAAQRLKALIVGRTLTVMPDPRSDAVDRYGRRLGYPELDGRDVALELITEGLVEAWYPSGEPRPERYPSYADAARSARQSRTGSWATCPTLGR